MCRYNNSFFPPPRLEKGGKEDAVIVTQVVSEASVSHESASSYKGGKQAGGCFSPAYAIATAIAYEDKNS